MYLKIHFYDKVLKYLFKDNLKTFDGLKQFIEEKIGLAKIYFKMIFVDLEGDYIEISSNDELDYFFDQKQNEDFKEIIVEKVRDSEYNGNKGGLRGNRRISTDVERSRRQTINVFKEHSLNNTHDWSVSTIKKPIELEDKIDDTDFKSLGLSHHSARRRQTGDESVKALEVCFTQLMSQVFEMKMSYESKFLTLESDHRELAKKISNIETNIEELRCENLAIRTDIISISKEVVDIKSQDDRLTARSRTNNADSFLTTNHFPNGKLQELTQYDMCRTQRYSYNIKPSYVMPKHDCKMCDAKPIVGKRYICLDCKFFHACECCALSKYHEHPLRLVINSVVPAENTNGSAKNSMRGKSSVPSNLQQSISNFKEASDNEKYPLEIIVPDSGEDTDRISHEMRMISPDKLPSKMTNNFNSIKNFIKIHVENDRKEYEKRKTKLDITFGEMLNEQQKDEIIKKDIALSYEDFTAKLKDLNFIEK